MWKRFLTLFSIKKKKKNSSLYASTSVICGLKVSIGYYKGKCKDWMINKLDWNIHLYGYKMFESQMRIHHCKELNNK